MYLYQQLRGYRLVAIMRTFELSNIGFVSFIRAQIRKRNNENTEFVYTMLHIKRSIIKHAT